MEVQHLEEEEKPRFDWDRMWLGIVLGAIGPVFPFFGYYLINYGGISFARFLHTLNIGEMYIPIIKLCVIANLLIFFIFIWTNKYRSARGVLLATFLYAFLIVYLTFA